jgi:hypothetical protein
MSHSEAASALQRVMVLGGFAADVCISDVNGNGVPDFIVVHRDGTGTALHQLTGYSRQKAADDPEERKGIIGADFGVLALGGVSILQSESMDWEGNLVYLVAFETLFEVPVSKVAACREMDMTESEWRLCLVRAWVKGDRTDTYGGALPTC